MWGVASLNVDHAASEAVFMEQRKLNRDIEGAAAAVCLKHCQVAGRVSACRQVELLNSSCHAVQSGSDAVRIEQNSRVFGDVRAEQDITIHGSLIDGGLHSSLGRTQVTGSVIQGDILSDSAGIQIRDSMCRSKSIRAKEDVRIDESHLADELSIESLAGDVRLVMPKGHSTKLGSVLSAEGCVSCWNGSYGLVRSRGATCLVHAKVDRLELIIGRGEELAVDLTASTVRDVVVQSQKQEPGGQTEDENPKDRSPTKVSFFAGEIIGAIRSEEGVELDLSHTCFAALGQSNRAP